MLLPEMRPLRVVSRRGALRLRRFFALLGVWNDSLRVLRDPDAFHRPILQEHQARLRCDGRQRGGPNSGVLPR